MFYTLLAAVHYMCEVYMSQNHTVCSAKNNEIPEDNRTHKEKKPVTTESERRGNH